MQQQPRRWPGFDKCVETKLRWDVYIRPWPPGWSFWRRIYTSRGSERVKNDLLQLPWLFLSLSCLSAVTLWPGLVLQFANDLPPADVQKSSLLLSVKQEARARRSWSGPNSPERQSFGAFRLGLRRPCFRSVSPCLYNVTFFRSNHSNYSGFGWFLRVIFRCCQEC